MHFFRFYSRFVYRFSTQPTRSISIVACLVAPVDATNVAAIENLDNLIHFEPRQESKKQNMKKGDDRRTRIPTFIPRIVFFISSLLLKDFAQLASLVFFVCVSCPAWCPSRRQSEFDSLRTNKKSRYATQTDSPTLLGIDGSLFFSFWNSAQRRLFRRHVRSCPLWFHISQDGRPSCFSPQSPSIELPPHTNHRSPPQSLRIVLKSLVVVFKIK